MAAHLGDRVIGICDSPSGLADRVVRAIGADPAAVRVDYAGLNHLGWLYGVHPLGPKQPSRSAVGPGRRPASAAGSGRRPASAVGPGERPSSAVGPGRRPASAAGSGEWPASALGPGRPAAPGPEPQRGDGNLLGGLLDDRARLASIEEGRLFGPDRLRELRAVPNEYLHYYYDPAGTLAAVRDAARTRGEFLLGQQHRCYAEIAAHDPLDAWLSAWREREATYMAENRELAGAGEREHDESRPAGYEGVALAVMRALAHDEPATLILNVRNRGTLDVLDDDAVVEVPCTVDGDGAAAQRIGPLPAHGVELVRAVKATERWVLEAATSGSRTAAVRAMAAHPLVGPEAAAGLIDAYRAEFGELAYLRPDGAAR